MNVPVITTERLILRGHTLADFEAVYEMWADPVVVKHIGGKPRTREDSWMRLQRQVGHWALLGYGTWAIEERAGGAYVGGAGIARYERNITEMTICDYEGGWVFTAGSHGKGYATEAMTAALAWFDANYPATPTECIIDVTNTGSLRVAQKLGYVEIGRATYHDDPIIVSRREPAPRAASSAR
ncbi:MAG: GNAT family N-acetyltransferase [Kofleriaceae bacterium]